LQPDALAIVQELLALGLPNYDAVRFCWRRTKTILDRPDVRIHDLRHTRASALARGGASLMQIGKVLGHTAPATTARYTHLVDADLVDLVERS
jgi:integrase